MHDHVYERRAIPYFTENSRDFGELESKAVLLKTLRYEFYCKRKGCGRGSFVTDMDKNTVENKELAMVIKNSLEELQPSNEAGCTMLLLLNQKG